MKRVIIIVLLMFSLPSYAGFYFTSQEAQTEALKKYDVVGRCQSHPKDFSIFSDFWKQSNSKYKTKCRVINTKKEIQCITSHPTNGVESIATTKWFNTLKTCNSEKKKYTRSVKNKKLKQKSYYYSYRDYKYDEQGYGSVISASRDCYKLMSSHKILKSSFEKIAKREGFLGKGKCQDGAFPGTYSCKKNKVSSRAYVYFSSNRKCKNDLSTLKSNYGL